MDVAAILGEGVLIGGCAVGALVLVRRPGPSSLWAVLGLGLVALAAAVGALRFGGLQVVVPAHQLLSRVATAGVSLLGVAWLGSASAGRAWHGLGGVLLVLAVVLAVAWPEGPWRLPISLVGVVGVLVGGLAWLRSRPLAAGLGMVGIIGVVLAGLVVAGEGAWLGVDRREWFHLVLAAGLVGVAVGLSGVGGSGRRGALPPEHGPPDR